MYCVFKRRESFTTSSYHKRIYCNWFHSVSIFFFILQTKIGIKFCGINRDLSTNKRIFPTWTEEDEESNYPTRYCLYIIYKYLVQCKFNRRKYSKIFTPEATWHVHVNEPHHFLLTLTHYTILPNVYHCCRILAAHCYNSHFNLLSI